MMNANGFLCLAGLLAVPGLANASPDLEALSLEDLMDLETDVATRIPQSEREVPGVLTVIHRDQIRRSGARDLLDLLQRVPGVHSDLDVQGVLGLAVRGQLADNGRVLLLLDGQVLTEPMYGTSPLGGRFSLDNIQRIEIVRGPAAARYGGGASAAVINIVSVAAEGAEGVRVHAQGCARPAGVGCAIAGGSAVFRRGDDLRVGLMVHGGDTRMMSGLYKDYWGDGFDAHAVNRVRELQVVGRLDVGSVHVQGGIERHARRQQDSYDEIAEEPHPNEFDTAWLRAWADRELGERWTVRPTASLLFSRPWHSGGDFDVEDANFYDRQVGRFELDVGAIGLLGQGVQLDLGAGGSVDHLRSGPQWEDWPLPSGLRDAVYGLAFARAELLWVRPRFNLTVGSRAEYQSPLGARLVPRVAVTTSSDKAHLKFQAAGALRAPTYEQMFPGLDEQLDVDVVSAERSVTLEAEGGVRPMPGVAARANVFATSVMNPIIADATEDDYDFYFNGDSMNTVGAEGEIRISAPRADVTASYAFATPISEVTDALAVYSRANRVAALPRHSGTIQGAFSPNGWFWVSPVARVIGPRTVFVDVDEDDELIEGDLPMALLVDLTIRAENVGQTGLDIEIGAHDLLDQDPGWHQPFRGWHAPMPGRGREARLKVSWRR